MADGEESDRVSRSRATRGDRVTSLRGPDGSLRLVGERERHPRCACVRLYTPPSSSAANKPVRCSSAVVREEEATWLTLRKINVASGEASVERNRRRPRGSFYLAGSMPGRRPAACVYVCVRLRCRGANDGEAEAGQRARTVPSLSNHRAVKLGRELFPECSRVFELIPGY